MSTIKSKDLMVYCSDGKIRSCPDGLLEELQRAFGPPPVKMNGPILTYPNGVKIQVQDEAMVPVGKLIDIEDIPHIVIKGPDEGKEKLPPFITSPVGDSRQERPMGIVEIYDTAIYMLDELERRSWKICWPGFTPQDGRKVVEALLSLIDIPAYVSFRDLGYGRWLLRRVRKGDPLKTVRVMANKRLSGSKYPWANLQPNAPQYIQSASASALHGNFRSWANRRGISWGIKMKTFAGDIVEVTRVDDKRKRVYARGLTL